VSTAKTSAADFLKAIPGPAAGLVKELIAAADARRQCLYVVGGPVRDFLLERPVVDVDLIVEGGQGAGDLAEAVATAEARVTRHDRFGTVVLRSGEASLDLATVRSESYAHDGALPTVAAGTLEDDLKRRDFTVNAMALALSKRARARHGGIIDLEGGLGDLEDARLRVLHPRSFHDDPTRALRAARLGPRLGFSLTRGSRGVLRDALRDGAFGRVSGERLRRELVKLFDDGSRGLDPARAMRCLNDWHVLGALEPGLGLSRDAVSPLRRLGRATAAPPWPGGRWRPWVSGLAVWLASAAPGLRSRTLRRFAVRGATATRIAEFAKAHKRALRALNRARGRGAIDAVLSQLDEDELHALWACAPTPLRRRIARYAGEDRSRRVPVNGDDLVELGLSGPALGKALARLRVAYLDGAATRREELLALARELAGAAAPRAAKRRGARTRR
jgi:tRNA nucleotidyltransferase (CCA-adding enzyme)